MELPPDLPAVERAASRLALARGVVRQGQVVEAVRMASEGRVRGGVLAALATRLRSREQVAALEEIYRTLTPGDGVDAAPTVLEADWTRAVELEPTLIEAWARRASARQTQGDLEGAVADGTRALELDPAFANAWMARASARRATSRARSPTGPVRSSSSPSALTS